MNTNDSGNSDQISSKDLADLIHQDVQHYDDLVRDHLSRIQQLILAVFTIAGVAGTLLYGYHQYVVLLAIPLVGCVLLFIMANITGEMFALAAHKYFLEQELSKLLGESLPVHLRKLAPPPWDSAGGRISRRSISYKAIQASGILALVIISIVTIAIAWIKMHDYWWLAPIIAAITVVFMLIAFLCYVQAVLAYSETLTTLMRQGGWRTPNNGGAKSARSRYDLARIIALLKGGSDEDWESWKLSDDTE